jgi:hypothetical protein
MVEAAKAGQSLKRDVLRQLLAAMRNAEIAKQAELTNEDVLKVIAREIKHREEASEHYKQGGREEQAAQEKQEAEILRAYLPPQLSEEELRQAAEEVIREVKAGGLHDLGKVMGALMARVKGRASGEAAQRIVRALLAERESSAH